MRVAVHLEQKRFFRQSGYILFEDLFSSEEGQTLLKAIRRHLRDRNNDSRFSRDIYRLLPEVVSLIQKRKMGQIAVELSGRPALALVGDLFLENFLQDAPISSKEESKNNSSPLGLEEKIRKNIGSDAVDCYLVIYLNSEKNSCRGIYFSKSLPEEHLWLFPGEAVLCLSFSDRGGNAKDPLFR
ncbi:DUF5070 domain-containing protein [Chlamydiifrater phoenicopteri]|uniref:DUF5070 domain-containing protein n=1 Tax=Chlamydiifrater phoenicopteri TaxID=2681469 RepID=UPI001BCC6253|nr:DUF5070 domain-containing protein [Chlamydiifrater phoenicopteri]